MASEGANRLQREFSEQRELPNSFKFGASEMIGDRPCKREC
jgi:hypothetical protein